MSSQKKFGSNSRNDPWERPAPLREKSGLNFLGSGSYPSLPRPEPGSNPTPKLNPYPDSKPRCYPKHGPGPDPKPFSDSGSETDPDSCSKDRQKKKLILKEDDEEKSNHKYYVNLT